MTAALLLLIALALVAACGAFVAAEFALLTVDRNDAEAAAKDGDERAAGVLQALRTLSTQLSAAQVGITVTNLLIGFLAQPAIAELVDGPLGSAGLPEDAVDGVALAIALVLATGVTMVFGELVPKNLAIARPLQTARAVQGFQRGFATVNGPLIRGLNGCANRILRSFGVEPQEELASARSAEELTSVARRSAAHGTLDHDTAVLLERSLVFGGRHAVDVMTPRERAEVLDIGATVHDLFARARETGRSRYPVVDPDDGIAGVVLLKDAVRVAHGARRDVAVTEVMREPVLVPTSIDLDSLLVQLRAGDEQLAIVINEFGGFDGLVTLEDLVEEIVGDVRDEHDDDQPDAGGQAPDGSWLLSGLLRPDEVRDLTLLELPEHEDYDTLAGLVTARLGRLPERGDRVRVEVASVDGPLDVDLHVEALDGLRVDRIRLSPRRPDPVDTP
ncbi:hypothetical protein DSM112329_03349 [Paraconexibacter sp. AEG42_29]|uniref:HlyC/CorC family transporter n=1 Tax=Paraconexibacter sp. AEG42_29 TaxID=2997339 RepID=A0AAU7AXU7_9ACTN